MWAFQNSKFITQFDKTIIIMALWVFYEQGFPACIFTINIFLISNWLGLGYKIGKPKLFGGNIFWETVCGKTSFNHFCLPGRKYILFFSKPPFNLIKKSVFYQLIFLSLNVKSLGEGHLGIYYSPLSLIQESTPLLSYKSPSFIQTELHLILSFVRPWP